MSEECRKYKLWAEIAVVCALGLVVLLGVLGWSLNESNEGWRHSQEVVADLQEENDWLLRHYTDALDRVKALEQEVVDCEAEGKQLQGEVEQLCAGACAKELANCKFGLAVLSRFRIWVFSNCYCRPW